MRSGSIGQTLAFDFVGLWVLAATIVRGLTPTSAYNGGIDKDKWVTWRLPRGER